MRNYANVTRQIGGSVYERMSNYMAYIKILKDGKEIG